MISSKNGIRLLAVTFATLLLTSAITARAEPDETQDVNADTAASSKTPDSAPSEAADSKPVPKDATDQSSSSMQAEKMDGAPTDQDAPSDKKSASTDEKPEKLTVASWGGAYGESQRRAYFAPFESETGIAIDVVSHNGKFEELGSGNAGTTKWDVIDVNAPALEQACRDGLLEKVDVSALSAANDGTSARDDFFPDSLHECGVPSVAWSSTIVFDKRAFKKSAPTTAKDFFDVKRFPGKRALPNSPKYTMELALMADGVSPADVYEVLATDEGTQRALNRLDAIRDHIVWWKRAREPLTLLDNQQVAMAVAFNGRIFSSIVAESKPFGIVWDGQVFDIDLWAIPKGSPHVKSALDFIAFATRPVQLAKQAGWFPYGPMRKSAVELVGKHPEVDVKMSEYIPTSKTNFDRALRLDTAWWQQHEDRLEKSLEVWITGDGGSAESGLDAESEDPVR